MMIMTDDNKSSINSLNIIKTPLNNFGSEAIKRLLKIRD